jgi:hypothetical protein
MIIELGVTHVDGLTKLRRTYQFDTTVDFVTQFKAICSQFEFSEVMQEKYCLLQEKKYIRPDKTIDSATVFGDAPVRRLISTNLLETRSHYQTKTRVSRKRNHVQTTGRK